MYLNWRLGIKSMTHRRYTDRLITFFEKQLIAVKSQIKLVFFSVSA